jgi:hypothetical protein
MPASTANAVPTAAFNRKPVIAQIHIIRTQLAKAGVMDEDGYREALANATQSQFNSAGSRSCAVMREYELKDAARYFRKLAALHKIAGYEAKATPASAAVTPQQAKVQALWYELHAAGKVRNAAAGALNAYVKRMAQVDSLRFADHAQCQALIEALKQWLAR